MKETHPVKEEQQKWVGLLVIMDKCTVTQIIIMRIA